MGPINRIAVEPSSKSPSILKLSNTITAPRVVNATPKPNSGADTVKPYPPRIKYPET